MKAKIRKLRLIPRFAAETIRSWLRKEVSISRPVLLLLYINAYIVSNYVWNSSSFVLKKVFALVYLFTTFFLIVYAHTLIPQTSEEEI